MPLSAEFFPTRAFLLQVDWTPRGLQDPPDCFPHGVFLSQIEAIDSAYLLGDHFDSEFGKGTFEYLHEGETEEGWMLTKWSNPGGDTATMMITEVSIETSKAPTAQSEDDRLSLSSSESEDEA
ncbi:hypothetical protein MMC13_003528 [Lambiella insularis]|nr:hypothetical protein [Lambiella insularis]